MHSEHWWQKASVIDELFIQPTSFEFFQSVRLLRHKSSQKYTRYWAKEYRFDSSLNLNFPISEIESLELDDDKIRIKNLIVGLTGLQGAMPYTYTNKVKQAPRKYRIETQEFLSLFNHKLVSQFLEASFNYNLPIQYEISHENHYLDILHALCGYVSSQHQQNDLDHYFAEFSGLMQGQNNTAHALRTMLSCIFNENIEIEQYIEEKYYLELSQRTCIGQARPSLLGINCFCGESIKQLDGKIEIRIGPLTYKAYLDFLPGHQSNQKLKKILSSWCDPTLVIDVRLILAKEEIQAIQLSDHSKVGLSRGAFLMPFKTHDNSETLHNILG
ncbi:type VI secretion system baseplate subunit TssG [Acinetobacter gerneri]|uniref:type VI secretion system baseplate subunit TssG n=1 Tax=Acinetobacter gerneri TaxID=202952 RepID=UPI003A896D5A